MCDFGSVFEDKTDIGVNVIKAAVLTGGIGEERAISLESGRGVAEGLSAIGVEVTLADVTPSNMCILDDKSVDIFFLALHGRFGEDGQLQGVLDEKSLVYTGSGAVASRLAIDKMASKKAFSEAGMAVPRAVDAGETDAGELAKALGGWSSGRYVVKPLRQGSSFGVEIVSGVDAAIDASRRCGLEFGDCMIEEFIEGCEVTVGVVSGEVLPIIEIRTGNSFYDYQAKYVDDKTEFLFDTIEDSSLRASIESIAMKCFRCLGCKDFGRVDFMISADGVVYPLEVNTIPGFTSHSLLPMAAARNGFSMGQLCLKIIESALAGERV